MELHGQKLYSQGELPFESRGFFSAKSSHEISSFFRYELASALAYIRRCYVLRGLEATLPEVRAVPVEVGDESARCVEMSYVIDGAHQIEKMLARTEVVDALNRWWVLDAAGYGWRVPDMYLLNLDLSVPTIRMQATEKDDDLVVEALAAGRANRWVSRSVDPPFEASHFRRAPNLACLEMFFLRRNWCAGSTIFYGDLAFIEQVGAGDEWLTLRRGVKAFESMSFGHMLEKDPDSLRRVVEDLHAATDEELLGLKYSGTAERVRAAVLRLDALTHC